METQIWISIFALFASASALDVQFPTELNPLVLTVETLSYFDDSDLDAIDLYSTTVIPSLIPSQYSTLPVLGNLASALNISTTIFASMPTAPSPQFQALCKPFDPTLVRFYVFTREDPFPTLLDTRFPINHTNFNPTRNTKFLIHGWLQEGKSFAEEPKNALLRAEDVNVISVDWSTFANCGYVQTALTLIPNIAKVTSELISTLISSGSSLNSFHVIGHSFGAQLAGFVGKYMAPLKLPRITGLDPAGPWYKFQTSSGRLDKTDALFVDCIHTNGKVMGIGKNIGHVNFHPNGGSAQPACPVLDVLCSHQMSVKYYTQSVLNPKIFCSTKCLDYFDFLSGKCSGNDQQNMGHSVPSSAVGTYYLLTTDSPPYGLPC